MKKDELKKFLTDEVYPVLKKNSQGGYLSYALYKDTTNNRTQFLTGRVILGNKKDSYEAKFEYSNLILVRYWIDLDSVYNTFLGLERNATFSIGLLSMVNSPKEFSFVRKQSVENVTLWPEWQLKLQNIRNSKIESKFLKMGPIVARGHIPYNNIVHAVNSFVWGKSREKSRTDDCIHEDSNLCFFIPDYRGRIHSIDWRKEWLNLEIDSYLKSKEMELQTIQYHSNAGYEFHSIPFSQERKMQVPVRASTTFLELYFICGEEILDFQNLARPGDSFDLNHYDALSRKSKEDISNGESDYVEFKPFIKKSKIFPKMHEIIKTVTAFSNTHGGSLYLGVDDHGVPMGEEKLLQASHASSLDEGIQVQVEQAEKYIRNKISPTPDFRIDWLEFQGERIVVITVQKGKNRPYSTFENDIYIRKGATNKKPDPQTELPRDLLT
jgi:hypothetical protein